jgi:hypothetical protein
MAENDTQRFLRLAANATAVKVELWEDDGVRDPSRLNAAVSGAGEVHVMRVEWQIGYYYRFRVEPAAVLEALQSIAEADLLSVPSRTAALAERGARAFPVRIVLVNAAGERREIVSASDREDPRFAACHLRLRALVDPRARGIEPYRHGGPWVPGWVPFP